MCNIIVYHGYINRWFTVNIHDLSVQISNLNHFLNGYTRKHLKLEFRTQSLISTFFFLIIV